MKLNYFTERDFETAVPKCRMDQMKSHFLHRLDVARFHAGVPFIINSAYRTVDHEKEKGRDGSSSHTKGLAADLKASNHQTRFKILQGLIKAGFVRFGIHSRKGFIHVDLDEEKQQEVIWGYED